MIVKKMVLGAFLLFLATSVLADVQFHSGWARLLPPGVTTTAGYLELSVSEADRLLSASSPVAGMVEIHQTEMQDGLMSMSEVDAIDLQAGEKLVMAPGGYHLMIMGLQKPLQAGAVLPVELVFEKAGRYSVELKVEAR